MGREGEGEGQKGIREQVKVSWSYKRICPLRVCSVLFLVFFVLLFFWLLLLLSWLFCFFLFCSAGQRMSPGF